MVLIFQNDGTIVIPKNSATALHRLAVLAIVNPLKITSLCEERQRRGNLPLLCKVVGDRHVRPSLAVTA